MARHEVAKRLFFFHTNADYLVGLRLPMLKALVQAGYEVTAFAPNLAGSHIEKLDRHGIAGRRYELEPTGLNPLRDLRALFKLWQLMRKEHPDLVFVNNIKPVVFGGLAAAFARVPRRYALVGGLGYAFTDAAGGERRWLERIIASALYAVVFRVLHLVIFHNADDLSLMARRRICPRRRAAVVQGSGVDISRFTPFDRNAAKPDNFIFVGRLLRDKGISEYLAAAEKVKALHPSANFVVVGGADSNPTAIDVGALQRLHETGVVHWVGQVDDVRPYLRDASVFVLPSYREGLPRSTLEALACGLAVITTDAPGCRETVRDGVNGLLVPVRDEDSLAQAMMRLCGNPHEVETMGKAGRRLAEEKFSIEQVNQEILRLIDGLNS